MQAQGQQWSHTVASPILRANGPFGASSVLPDASACTWLVFVYPLSGIADEELPLEVSKIYEDMLSMRNLLPKVLPELESEIHTSFYSLVRIREKYNHVAHIYILEEEIVDIAQEMYLDFCSNRKSIKKMYIVAAESGAFMVARLLQFINVYGVDMYYGCDSVFPRLWHSVLAGRPQPPFPDEVTSRPRFPIRHVILIRPSLPSLNCLGCVARWVLRPRFYRYTDFASDDVPCQFLWWIHDAEEHQKNSSNALIDMGFKATCGKISKVTNAKVFEEEIAIQILVPLDKAQRQIFITEKIARVAAAAAAASSSFSPSEITQNAILKIEQWYNKERSNSECYDPLVDLAFEASEVLKLQESASRQMIESFWRHIEGTASYLKALDSLELVT